jgi:hypothetical protein
MDPAVVWARAALLAAVTMFLGVAGHVTADGRLPSLAWILVLAVLAVVPCAALLARPASTLRLVLTLGGGQALVHLALTVTAGHTTDAGSGHVHAGATTPHVETAGSALETLQSAQGLTTSGGLAPGVLLGHLVDHAPMMVVHLLAAALVGLWLGVGERALWTVAALTASLVLRPLQHLGLLARTGLPLLDVLSPAPPEPVRPPATRLLARSVVRRGPPLLAT